MNSQPATPIHGVIFDLDGTLVESQLNFPLLRQLVNCPEGTDILTHVASLDHTEQARAHAVIEQHELEDAQQASWLPGAQHLVEALLNLNLPLAIITRNSPEAASIKVANNQIPIDWVLTRADGPAKPDPSVLLHVAKTWQISPEHIMYVGDYKYDLQAANNAGMQACLYAPDGIPEYAHLADHLVSDLEQLSQFIHQMVTN